MIAVKESKPIWAIDTIGLDAVKMSACMVELHYDNSILEETCSQSRIKFRNTAMSSGRFCEILAPNYAAGAAAPKAWINRSNIQICTRYLNAYAQEAYSKYILEQQCALKTCSCSKLDVEYGLKIIHAPGAYSSKICSQSILVGQNLTQVIRFSYPLGYSKTLWGRSDRRVPI